MIRLTITFTIIIIFLSCVTSSQSDKISVSAQNKSLNSNLLFSLEIEQNGNIIYPINHVFKLSKKPFKLRYYLDADTTFYSNFNQSPALYNSFISNNPAGSIVSLGENAMVEDEKNPDRHIVLSDRGWHAWYTPTEDDSRFDNFQETSKGMLCERTVNILYDLHTRQTIDLNDATTIYIVYCDVTCLGFFKYKLNEIETATIEFE
jgi:hypothetical protein